MSLRQTAAPTVEPVSLDALKSHLRVDGDDENDLLTAYLSAARTWCETFQGRAYVSQTWKATLDRFPDAGEEWVAAAGFITAADAGGSGVIRVPRPPLQSVTSIQYVDTNGTTQTLSTSDYQVDASSEPGRIVPAYLDSWPSTRDVPNAVIVTYVAGFATPFTAATTDTCTAAGRALTSGEAVRVTNYGGGLPGGLAVNTDYYARDISGLTFKLAATAGGSAIDITTTGTGTHFLGEIPERVRVAVKMLAAHFYENREPVNVGNITTAMPLSVESLLWQERCF